ncbi:MAG: hypothetical protein ACRD36_09240, partial [Candidatus Acidiferrum sp.]
RWRAFQLGNQIIVAALEKALPKRDSAKKPMDGRIVAVVGTDGFAHGLAKSLQARGANLIIAGHDKAKAQGLAHELGCRFILIEAIYSTMHHVLVVCPAEPAAHGKESSGAIHPGYLRPDMTVVDLTAPFAKSTWQSEAASRGCNTVSPQAIFAQRLCLQMRIITGQEVPLEFFQEVLDRFSPESGEN